MTTTNLIFQTNKEIVVSKKLNLILKNIDDEEWKESIVEDVTQEMVDRIKEIEKYSFDQKVNYDIKGIRKVVDNVLMIEISDLEKSLYKKINKYMDNPTCEGKTFQVKFIELYNFVNSSILSNKTNCQICITYDSMSINGKTDYLRFSGIKDFKLYNVNNYILTNKQGNLDIIDNLCNFGKKVDKYIRSDKYFFQLKYIMDALGDESNYNAFYIFKIVSIIEMLIKNPKNKSWNEMEYEEFAKYVLCEDREIANDIEFVRLVIQIRNKIAHCDTKALSNKLKQYKKEYMKCYSFDYHEYSEENWIYLNLSCRLNEILANILFSKIMLINS